MARNHTPFVGRPFNQPVTHNQLNDHFRATENSQAISVAPPLTIENTLGGGTRIGIVMPPVPPTTAAAESVVTIKQFKIVRQSDSDVLQCRDYTGGGIVSFDNVWVAKDWFMRGPDTWNGITRNNIKYSHYSIGNQTRRATKAARAEKQTIVPAYIVGDIIIAFKVDTGLIVPGTEEDDEPRKVEWVEPAGTRMWMVVA